MFMPLSLENTTRVFSRSPFSSSQSSSRPTFASICVKAAKYPESASFLSSDVNPSEPDAPSFASWSGCMGTSGVDWNGQFSW